MGFTLEDFSRKQTLDLETAMASAIARLLEEAVFSGPPGGGPLRLAAIFEDWPSWEDGQQSPAACILPDAPLVYDEAYPEPWLMEETWEPVGRPGFGLYALSEASRELEVVFRASTAAARDALKAGVEKLFFEPGTSAIPSPGRYGRLLCMPEYFGMPVRVAISDSRKTDDGDKAVRNVWEFVATLKTQARHVRVDRVRPFTLHVQEVIEGPQVT